MSQKGRKREWEGEQREHLCRQAVHPPEPPRQVQLPGAFKYTRDRWVEGIGKKKSALTGEMAFTKREVITNMFKSMGRLMMLN